MIQNNVADEDVSGSVYSCEDGDEAEESYHSQKRKKKQSRTRK